MNVIDFDRQDLINLSKVADIEKSTDSSYEVDGATRSMYQRNETGYRVQVKDDPNVYMFIFNDKNKLVAKIHQTN